MLKRLGLCAAALLFAIGTATNAHAAPFTFFTTGTFGSTSTNSLNIGAGASTVNLTFTGASASLTTPTFVPFGTIKATGGNNTAVAPVAGETFTLSIFQTVPGAGSGTFVGSMTGTIKASGSSLFIQFSAPFSVVISGIKYILLEADQGVQGRTTIVPPNAGGLTSIEGRVVPEPASALLLGLGLLGSAAAARRRKARV